MDTLYFKQQGEGDKSVVLLHGLFGAGGNLGELARHLRGQQYRVISVDLINHGRSPWQDDMDYPGMARDIEALLNHLQLESADIIGHSMGGKVAMQLALQAADRVKQLVIADIAPVAYPPRHDAVIDALVEVAKRGPKRRKEALIMLEAMLAEPGVAQFLLKSYLPHNSSDPEQKPRWRFNLAAIQANYQQLSSAPQGHAFNGPTLFIKGELSDYINENCRNAVEQLFPKAVLRQLNGTGHWLHAEKPTLFNSTVSRFLNA